MRAAALVLTALLLGHPAQAERAPERVPVRLGDHPAHGRVVLDLAAPDIPYTLSEEGGAVLLRLGPDAGSPALPPMRRPPRNLAALEATADGLRLTLRPGARLRDHRLGPRLVLDILDPPRDPSRQAAETARPAAVARQTAEAARPAAIPARQTAEATPPTSTRQAPGPVPPTATVPAEAAAPRPAAPARPEPRTASRARPAPRTAEARAPEPRPDPPRVIPQPPPLAAAPPPPAVTPSSPPPTAPAATTPPTAEAALPTGLPLRAAATPEGRALHLPLPEETGLAILRRGDLLLILLDRAVALDTAPLRDDPVFRHLAAEHRPDATLLRLPIAAPAALVARRRGTGWLLAPVEAPERARSIAAEPEEGAIALRAAGPGRPVPVTDPETGLPILVGTVTEPGQSTPALRSLPQADLLPTQLGVAALARADTAALRRAGDRFLLTGLAGAAPLPDSGPDAAALTRLTEFPALDPAAAQERLRALSASLAAAPPLARLPLRRAAAEGMLALGLFQEAQSMLRLAFQEDPRAAADPRTLLLHAAAALLAGRPAEAGALATLPPSDEATLWRAALAATDGKGGGAPGFAATVPLLLAYPDPLRARLLPLAAEALLDAGDLPPARRLLRAAGERPELALAAARLAEAENRPEEALARLDALAAGRDRQARAAALRRAAEIRLAAGTLGPAAAAAALEAALYAWRGDAAELDARLRIAELRARAGAARTALDLLAETAAAHPEAAARIRPAQEAAFLQALAQEPPTAAIALHEAHPGLLPADARGAEALATLAERLATMDLPGRGAALMATALAGAPPAARPALATRLAALQLAAARPADALATLRAAPADPAEATPRALLAARALAALDRPAEAEAALRPLGPEGLPALAELQAGRQDWPAAADTLLALASARPDEAETPSRLLRAAAFAALGNDSARLARIRAEFLPRLAPGPAADGIALLAADPVRALSDLPRLSRELDLFRGFPKGLEAFRASAPFSG